MSLPSTGPLALRTLELLVGKLRKNYDALQQLHAVSYNVVMMLTSFIAYNFRHRVLTQTARKDLDEQWNAIKYPIEKREKFLAIVEGEKVEAAKRKLSQVFHVSVISLCHNEMVKPLLTTLRSSRWRHLHSQ